MPYHFFSIRAISPDADQQDLNRFIASHRVVAVRWRWIDRGDDSRWVARVEVASGTGPLPDALKAGGGSQQRSKERIDYREELSKPDFDLYAAIRKWRSDCANKAGVKLYAILTNEQMATIVTSRTRTLADLAKIPGIGPGRLEKYGRELVEHLQTLEWPSDEANTPTDSSSTPPTANGEAPKSVARLW